MLFDLYFLLQVGLFFLNSEAYFENQEEFYTDSEKSQIKIMFGIAGLIALVEMLLCTYGLCLACPVNSLEILTFRCTLRSRKWIR